MEKKANGIYKFVMAILVTAILTFLATSIGMYNHFMNVEISEYTEDLTEKLEVVKNYLGEKYIGEIDTAKMEEYAIKGYVAGLGDEYTEYLTKQEYEELLVSVTGDYVGIGIYMTMDTNGNIIVLMPIENSPAEEAGLQAEDIILSINGESTQDMDLEVASTKIKGEEGTKVELEILRGTETIKKTVERRTVDIPDSTSEILNGNIGYIELTTFDEGSAENVEKYLAEFKNKGIKSVIIDLRNNTGGIVTEAIEFSELFVKKRRYNNAFIQ